MATQLLKAILLYVKLNEELEAKYKIISGYKGLKTQKLKSTPGAGKKELSMIEKEAIDRDGIEKQITSLKFRMKAAKMDITLLYMKLQRTIKRPYQEIIKSAFIDSLDEVMIIDTYGENYLKRLVEYLSSLT